MAGLHRADTEYNGTRDTGVLIFAVRKDDLATVESERFADDGNFHPFVVDADGYLRVNVPTAGVKVSEAPSVQELLEQTNSLLRRLVLAMEMVHGTEIPDPA